MMLPEVAAGQLGPRSVCPGSRHPFDYLNHTNYVTITNYARKGEGTLSLHFCGIRITQLWIRILLFIWSKHTKCSFAQIWKYVGQVRIRIRDEDPGCRHNDEDPDPDT